MQHKSIRSARSNRRSASSSHGEIVAGSRIQALDGRRARVRGSANRAGQARVSIALCRSVSLLRSAVPPRFSTPWPTWRTLQTHAARWERPNPRSPTAIPTQLCTPARSTRPWGARKEGGRAREEPGTEADGGRSVSRVTRYTRDRRPNKSLKTSYIRELYRLVVR